MAEELNIGTFEQIAEIASQLATNYSNLAGTFYDVFYNPTPKDVTFQMFDSSGKPHDYTVENLAKSNLYRKAGTVKPEGNVAAVKGTMYQDLMNGEAYIKKTGDGNQGWFQLVTKALLDGYIMQGNVDPNGELVEGEYVGIVSAPAGTLYINTTTTTLYIRLAAPSGGKHWSAISANVSGFAETDLSNITEAGRNVIKSEAASSIGDKTYTISSSSTDTQIPTAKAVYNTVNALGTSMGEINTRVNNLSTALGNLSNNVNSMGNTVTAMGTSKQDKSNLVTSISASSTDTQYPSAKCVYNLIGNLANEINAL